jgi:hypothetical protein
MAAASRAGCQARATAPANGFAGMLANFQRAACSQSRRLRACSAWHFLCSAASTCIPAELSRLPVDVHRTASSSLAEHYGKNRCRATLWSCKRQQIDFPAASRVKAYNRYIRLHAADKLSAHRDSHPSHMHGAKQVMHAGSIGAQHAVHAPAVSAGVLAISLDQLQLDSQLCYLEEAAVSFARIFLITATRFIPDGSSSLQRSKFCRTCVPAGACWQSCSSSAPALFAETPGAPLCSRCAQAPQTVLMRGAGGGAQAVIAAEMAANHAEHLRVLTSCNSRHAIDELQHSAMYVQNPGR